MSTDINLRKKVVLHIITGLETGGAEMMLYKILSKTNRRRFEPSIISLIDRGTLGDRIEALGIPVYSIGMEAGKLTLRGIWRFIHKVHQCKPDLVQGWMYHGNIAAQLAGIVTLKFVPVIWNIRHSLHSLSYEKASSATLIKILAPLSSFPKKILYNSKISAIQHDKLGYQVTKSIVIPNGFNTEFFRPSLEFRISVRTELGLSNDTFLIGRISRYDPMKDHANFLHAAALLLKDYPDVHFVLAGDRVDWENQTLCQLIDQLGIAERIHLLGERHDIPRLTAALDIACSSSSYGEAFPNAIGEAMACGVPCVVTDVGDSGWIVGNTGRVVPPRDSNALANASKELIALGSEGRNALGKAARTRIIENFSLDSIVAQYESLYESVLSGC
ncbi:group 1 glycosyl transferase [Kalymmatonema gypsitolerans NIES-4073]|nr:group 1 glycosyl transferase [Scytonema sp. NIES-4073]